LESPVFAMQNINLMNFVNFKNQNGFKILSKEIVNTIIYSYIFSKRRLRFWAS